MNGSSVLDGEMLLIAETSEIEDFLAEHGLLPKRPPVAIARPRDTEEVRAVISRARERGQAVVTMSSGPPHSHGVNFPDRDTILLDLRGMSKIIRTDRRNRVAIIEPGVTFASLDAALAPVGLRAMAPMAPRSGKSVLASYLDRVPTMVPRAQWDLSDPLLCTEVVMGTGDVFRTGCASGPGTLEEQWATGQAQKNPMGPSSFDFFRLVQGSRGALAVTTWASIKCEVRPREHRLILVSSEELAPLTEVVYRIMHARWGEECLILDGHALARLTGGQGGPAFTLLVGIAGFDHRPGQRVAYQEKGIRRIIQEEGLSTTENAGGANPRQLMETILTPSEPYWKDADGAHLDLYFLTTLDRCVDFQETLDRVCEDGSFDRSSIGIYIQPQLGGRIAHFEAVVFCRDEKDSLERARSFIRVLAEAAHERGAYFSRLAAPWADLAFAGKPLLNQVMRRVRHIFDPAGTLNPAGPCFEEVS
jgi:FAD/FMN-containing dehydrogenase